MNKKGYHSKSPEEFKKYFSELNQVKKSKNYKSVVIFIDVILISFLFFYITNYFLPEEYNLKIEKVTSSEMIQLDQFKLQLKLKSNEISNLYLLIENVTNQYLELSNQNNFIKSYFIKSQEGYTCYSEDLNLKLNLAPNEKKIYTINLQKLSTIKEILQDCKILNQKDQNPIYQFLRGKQKLIYGIQIIHHSNIKELTVK